MIIHLRECKCECKRGGTKVLKGIVTNIARFFRSKPTKDDAPSTAMAEIIRLEAVKEIGVSPVATIPDEIGFQPAKASRKPRAAKSPGGGGVRIEPIKLHTRDDAFVDMIVAEAKKIMAEGITSQNGIAKELNRRGCKTRTGKQFMNTTVANILAMRGIKVGQPRNGGRKKQAEKKAAPKAVDVTDAVLRRPERDYQEELRQMLPARTRVRADIVHRQKRAGSKSLTAEEITQIEEFIAAGKVVTYPSCVDSEGFNHLTQEQAA